MSLFLTVTAATQLCAGCTVEFEPTDTLGSTADPAGAGMIAEILRMDDRGYLMSSDALGPVVIVYDSEGRYQKELTREGGGPGELRGFPKFAMGSGGILIHEQFSPSLHLYSSDLEFTRTFRVPGVAGSVQPDPLTGGWLVSYLRAGDGSEAGILLLDQGGDVVRSMRVGEESSSLREMTGDAIRGTDGRIWIASMLGMVEVFDEDLGLLGSLKLELPGLEAWNPNTGPAAPPAMVLGMRAAPDGSGGLGLRVRARHRSQRASSPSGPEARSGGVVRHLHLLGAPRPEWPDAGWIGSAGHLGSPARRRGSGLRPRRYARREPGGPGGTPALPSGELN